MSEEQDKVEWVLDLINAAQKELTSIRRDLTSNDNFVLRKLDCTNRAFGFLNSARICFADWREEK